MSCCKAFLLLKFLLQILTLFLSFANLAVNVDDATAKAINLEALRFNTACGTLAAKNLYLQVSFAAFFLLAINKMLKVIYNFNLSYPKKFSCLVFVHSSTSFQVL